MSMLSAHSPATASTIIASPAPAAGAPTAEVKALIRILADTYALVVKTHGAHWNVRGPTFFSLHPAFEAQYQALFLAADELAERVRALGQDVPGSLAQLAAISSIRDTAEVTGEALARALRDDHRAIAKTCRETIAQAQSAADDPTADLLIQRAQEHDKTAWMLSSTLGD